MLSESYLYSNKKVIWVSMPLSQQDALGAKKQKMIQVLLYVSMPLSQQDALGVIDEDYD